MQNPSELTKEYIELATSGNPSCGENQVKNSRTRVCEHSPSKSRSSKSKRVSWNLPKPRPSSNKSLSRMCSSLGRKHKCSVAYIAFIFILVIAVAACIYLILVPPNWVQDDICAPPTKELKPQELKGRFICIDPKKSIDLLKSLCLKAHECDHHSGTLLIKDVWCDNGKNFVKLTFSQFTSYFLLKLILTPGKSPFSLSSLSELFNVDYDDQNKNFSLCNETSDLYCSNAEAFIDTLHKDSRGRFYSC